MISHKIIKIASNTKYSGLKNVFTHKSSVKNSFCGDFIKAEFIANKTKVKLMRYETESCVLCEASASLFAKKIKRFKIEKLIKDIKNFTDLKKKGKIIFPFNYKEFNQLLSRNSNNRINCVILPMEAFLKAFKIN
tara:strand:+ start:548 stop:952 length:405 start_codon:yes stop_codon:yes gene_type:complete